jgi:non-specific serine/threonine protein kinase
VPLRQLGDDNEFFAKLLASKRLFTTAYFSSYEAWLFLQGVVSCERAGIVVKLPRAWEGKRPSPLKIAVTVDSAGSQPSFVGYNSLFSFRVAMKIDGRELSAEEIAALLAADQGLVALHGQWVAVDGASLRPLLAKWQQAEQLQEQGLTFSEALRFLARMPQGQGTAHGVAAGDDETSWVDMVAGKALHETLASLKEPLAELAVTEQEVLATYLHAQLRPYQLKGVQWLQTLSRLGLGGCLADDMGLGKTLQVIALLVLEKSRGPVAPSLLVLPASLLGNWQGELKKFAPSLRVKVLHPSLARRNET